MPFTRRPLDNDPEKTGEPADHLLVIMPPFNSPSVFPARITKTVTYRPLPRSGIDSFGRWIIQEPWVEVFDAKTPTKKVEVFENLLSTKLNEHFPQKTVKITNQDQPWITPDLKNLIRRKKREYWKNGRSVKWSELNSQYNGKVLKSKKNFYSNFVEDLKTSQPGQWYTKLKRLAVYDQVKFEPIQIKSLEESSDQEAAELIANHFAAVSKQFEPIKRERLPAHQPSLPPPVIYEREVSEQIKSAKKTKSTLEGDIPYSIAKEFNVELATPLTNIFNSSLETGEYPQQWKHEIVTPCPKIFPPEEISDLRKICRTKHFSKIFESILGNYILPIG